MTLAAATGGTVARQWKALALGRPTLDEYLRDECAAYTPAFAGACHPPTQPMHANLGTTRTVHPFLLQP